MMMLALTLVVVGLSAYLWCTRGFFSALIHLVCVLAAGAVAFGVWEPLGYWLIGSVDERGGLGWLTGSAWGLSLALPFAITLSILRGAIDKMLPANAQCETTADYIGGGVCGLMSGVICAGIIVLSFGYLRLPSNFGGYQPVSYTSGTGRGSLEASKDPMSPWVDRITAGLYSKLSLTTLRTAEPLAKWHPDLVSEPGSLRTTYEDVSRNTVKPSGFNLVGWYTVGTPPKGGSIDELLKDSWNTTSQKVTDLQGDPIGNGYLAGFVVKFGASAKEKTGQVVVGNGQVELVVQNVDEDQADDTKALHPVAVVTNIDDPSQVAYARFRFDADNVYFSSVGGASETVMSFEFPVPSGYMPIALYVKGSRVEISANPGAANFGVPNYGTPAERDSKVQAGEMMGMGGVGPVLDSEGNPVKLPDQPQQTQGTPIQMSNTLGVTIQKGTEQNMDVVEAETGGGYEVTVAHNMQLRKDQLARFGSIDRKLQINRLQVAQGTAIAKVDFTPSELPDEFSAALDKVDKSKPPVLVDNNGTKYQPVGFMFTDATLFTLQYDVGHPIEKFSELPAVSRSNPDKKLTLLYSVSFGVTIEKLQVGDVVLEEFSSNNKAEFRQK